MDPVSPLRELQCCEKVLLDALVGRTELGLQVAGHLLPCWLDGSIEPLSTGFSPSPDLNAFAVPSSQDSWSPPFVFSPLHWALILLCDSEMSTYEMGTGEGQFFFFLRNNKMKRR